MRKSFLTILLVFIACTISFAQLGRSLQACWVHLNKPFYVVGDVVGYQLYLPPEFVGIDATIQTILFGANGQPLWYNYQQNQGASSLSGVLLLDTQLSTNWYYLSFRVWDDNRATERVLLQVPLAIYNDRESITPSQVSQQEPARLKDPLVVDNKDLTLTISISPEKPRAGEEVQLSISATNRRGKPVQADLSLSINNWSQLSTSLAMGMDNLHSGDSLRVVTPSFLTSGFYWQGVLLDEENQVLPNTQILVSTADESLTVNSDERGRFLFQPTSKNKNYRLELISPDGTPIKVQFMPQRGRLAMGELFYTPAAFRYLEANRQRREICELLQLPVAPLSDVQQNQLVIPQNQVSLEAYDESQQNNWTSNKQAAPANPGWIWQTKLQTDTKGEVEFTYTQAKEKAAFRVDVIGQSIDGQRARASLLYQIE